ncbi:unnamed protein product [Ectocarpus sp. CCAP 1310/34]|nr:unnamed protein product [Ectocarpus sp. CCAP 1310/34]
MFPAMFGPAVFATQCCLLAHTSGTRLKTRYGGQGKSPDILQLQTSSSFASWMTPDLSRSPSPLRATRQLWELFVVLGAFSCTDVVPSCEVSCAM